ncbi:hypothetical protein [Paraburkholderia lacunae]|uniref:hypothetical protein n=1 Tax=Paraburkholderia lacunae TaxID=2211104 RepID=UPI0010586ED4|nr:hypothetical protein [Paraburkholderia lacunae]
MQLLNNQSCAYATTFNMPDAIESERLKNEQRAYCLKMRQMHEADVGQRKFISENLELNSIFSGRHFTEIIGHSATQRLFRCFGD